MTQPPNSDAKPPSYRQRYKAWRSSLSWPLSALFMVALVFVLLILFDFVLPGADGIHWPRNVVTAIALGLGLEAGDAVATRRYGREALWAKDRMHWRAFGLFLLTMAAVMMVIFQIGDLFL